MKTTLKWILPIGAALSIIALFGLAYFSRFWMGQPYFPMEYNMMQGGSHHAFTMPGTSYTGFILGIVLLLVVVGVIVGASRSQTQSGNEAQPEFLENCPACDADLVSDWKHCPYCGYDLSQ